MEQIKVIFFLIGSIFAQENCRIASAVTEVQVDVPQKTIQITQQDIFTTTGNEDAFAYTKTQFATIVKKQQLSKELANFKLLALNFTKDGEKLNATVKLSYKTQEDLKVMGLFTTKEGQLSHVFVKDWNMATKEGVQKDKYWYFSTDKPFAFTLDMNAKMNALYQDKLQSLLPVWEAVK